MFENLSDKLDKAFKIIKGKGRITEINIAESLKEVRKALIDADVSYSIAKEFCATVKEKALGREVLTAVEPGQLMVKIVHDELTALMGGQAQGINLNAGLSVVLIAGLQGSGKTTFSAKLANYVKTKKNKTVLLVAGDVYRPAAIDQLKVLGEQINVEVYSEDGSKDPVAIARNAVAYAKGKSIGCVIVDTAGRLAIDEQMMDEISRLKTALSPSETLFVVDSMTGQDAVNTAKAFNEKIDYDGVVLTKLDGDTRGGGRFAQDNRRRCDTDGHGHFQGPRAGRGCGDDRPPLRGSRPRRRGRGRDALCREPESAAAKRHAHDRRRKPRGDNGRQDKAIITGPAYGTGQTNTRRISLDAPCIILVQALDDPSAEP